MAPVVSGSRVGSVNVGDRRRVGRSDTGIDKRPVGGPVEVRAPGGPKGAGGGIAADVICSGRHHGGDDQAIYAYAREDLDRWGDELGRRLANGCFGENLTTLGLDVTGAVIGERWHVGEGLVLEVSCPRIPCGTFQAWMGEPGWARRFTAAAVPGAYLRVVAPGPVRAGDRIELGRRPDHGVTIGVAFRALTLEPELLAGLAAADALPEQARQAARRAAAAP